MIALVIAHSFDSFFLIVPYLGVLYSLVSLTTYNGQCAGMQSSLKHSDWGSCGSPQRSCLPITTGHNIGTTEVQMLPSLASFSPGEEPTCTEIEPVHPELGRDQEVESPVKARGVERCSIRAQHSKGDPG